MAVVKDNHIDPNIKARWGFGGTEGKITVGPETVGETGGVDHARTRVSEGGGRKSGGGAEPSVETLQLNAVNALADGLEAGVLNPVEGDGPALRIHTALSGIQSSMESLAEARDSALAKSDMLQKQVDDLLLQAAQNADPRDSLTIPEIKEQLDAKEVKYSSTANKSELLELLKAQPATQE